MQKLKSTLNCLEIDSHTSSCYHNPHNIIIILTTAGQYHYFCVVDGDTGAENKGLTSGLQMSSWIRSEPGCGAQQKVL